MKIDFAYLLKDLHIMYYTIKINDLELLNKSNYLNFLEDLLQIRLFSQL